ncbi:MAG TPA: LCP family protein [Acidimicrobiales bacterium]|nr:LCP family protein [Acidimicrobiales bacterium]
MLTDGPRTETEGLRIAATRAGQRNGDGADGHDDAPTSRIDEAADERARTVRPPARSARVSPARAKVLRQRRRRRRILIGFTAFLAVLNLLVGSGFLYVQHRLGQIRRLDLPALSGDTPGSVMNVLLVGSDSRANVSSAEAAGFGKDQVYGQRSDTMMLLHVDPREQKAAIVSVPRDLYVPIADTGFSDRVNAAFALGGPDQLIATIQQALGITIHHYVQVDFVGFKDIVDTVGGVTMYVPYPVRDSGSGLDLGRAGCWELDGNKGLAWVRSRDMEFLINGTWQADGRGDLGRIERQQDFIRRMMKKALSSGVTNPLTLNRLISVGVRDVTFDSALSTKDLTALGRRFSSLDPDRVVLRTLPTDPADIDGKSVLKLQAAQARPMIDLLNGEAPVEVAPTTVPDTGATTTAPPPTTATGSTVKPSDVRIRVLNGLGTPGAAARAGTALTSQGFTVSDRGDAPALAPRTTITHGPGDRDKAQLVQSALLTPAVVQEDATLRSVDVNLVLGADYTGVKPAVSAGTAVTTVPPTTAAPTTVPPQINPVPLPTGTEAPPC